MLVPATASGLWIVSITSLLGLYNFNHGEYVAGAPSRIGHLDSRQSRDLPSDIARLARSQRNDDVGSHDPLHSTIRLLALLAVGQWRVQGTASRRALEIGWLQTSQIPYVPCLIRPNAFPWPLKDDRRFGVSESNESALQVSYCWHAGSSVVLGRRQLTPLLQQEFLISL